MAKDKGTYFSFSAFSIREKVAPPNIHAAWWPWKDRMFYLRILKYRIIFGPGAGKEYRGIQVVR